jgi:glycosyltransferase involved in cell wall biosynthesis
MALFLVRLADAAYEHVSPIARRWLPASVKRRFFGLVGAIEVALAAGRTRAPIRPLRDAAPLLGPHAFADGPILLVNNGLAWGGAERQLVNTILGLEARQDRPLRLICQKLGEQADYDFYLPALSTTRCAPRNMATFSEARARLSSEFGADTMQSSDETIAWLPTDVRERIVSLMCDIATLRPAVVHAWQDALSIEAGYAAALVGVPRIVLSARNLAPTNFAYHRPYMRDAYLQLVQCRNVVLLNNSEAGAASYAHWLGLEAERIQVLRNGLDFSAIQGGDRTEIRAALAIPPDAPVIGSVFRFYEEKRPMLWIDTAAQIAAALPEAHFVVYGAGPLLADARARAQRLGISERLHTPGAASNAASAIVAFDLFLLTSMHEGTPNVILEASALGAPVVATAAGGSVEAVLDSVTGRVLDADHPEPLADAALALLRDASFRARCVSEAPRFMQERFGLARMIDETCTIYGLDH